MSTYPQAVSLNVPEWDLSDRLRKIRTMHGWAQKEIAERLEVTASAYAQWEAGNSRPRHVVAIAQRLEVLTGVPAWWTLGLNAENRRPAMPDGGFGSYTPWDSNPEPTDYGSGGELVLADVVELWPAGDDTGDAAS